MTAFAPKLPANDPSSVSSAQSLDAVRDILFGAQNRDIQGRIDETMRVLSERVSAVDALHKEQLQALRTHADTSLADQQRAFGEQIAALREELRAHEARSAAQLQAAEQRLQTAVAALRQVFDDEQQRASGRSHAAADALRSAALALERADT
jgi:hypothetical protein